MVLDFWTILSGVLGLIAIVAGGFLITVKGKLNQVISLGREVVDLVEAFNAALADNTVSPEEVAAIKKELQAVKDAFKLLVSKA
jgi:hypothetical protein